jgi:uncharacterized protein (TIGR02246 family)
MKRLALIAATFFLTQSLVAADQGIAAVDQAWIKAITANDLEAVLALYAPDAVMYPPDAMEAKGKEAIRDNYRGLLSAMTVQSATITDSHYQTLGDTSIGWGRFTLKMVPKAGGDPIQMDGRFSAVAKKIGGKWLYVADHASVPMPPPPAK